MQFEMVWPDAYLSTVVRRTLTEGKLRPADATVLLAGVLVAEMIAGLGHERPFAKVGSPACWKHSQHPELPGELLTYARRHRSGFAATGACSNS